MEGLSSQRQGEPHRPTRLPELSAPLSPLLHSLSPELGGQDLLEVAPGSWLGQRSARSARQLVLWQPSCAPGASPALFPGLRPGPKGIGMYRVSPSPTHPHHHLILINRKQQRNGTLLGSDCRFHEGLAWGLHGLQSISSPGNDGVENMARGQASGPLLQSEHWDTRSGVQGGFRPLPSSAARTSRTYSPQLTNQSDY